MNIITVNGSHGSIEVHRESGHIIRAEPCLCNECRIFGDYRSILWFDPARWDACALKHGETDILNTAHIFRWRDGRVEYTREMSLVTDDQGFTEHMDLLMLPPPPDYKLIIGVNAWVELDNGDQTYADEDDGPVDGWSVYACHREKTGGEPIIDPVPGGLDYDEDFDTFDAAHAKAQQLAEQYNGEVRVY